MHTDFSDYIKKIYKLLGKNNRSQCFISGSFVIRDDNEELFNALETDYNWVPIESHRRFKQEPWQSKRRVRDRYIKKSNRLEIRCGEGKKRIVTAIKYYQFEWSDASNVSKKMKKAKYVYFKIERSVSTRLIHIIHFMNSNIGKITGKRWKEYRRDEKCKKNCEKFVNDHELFENKDDKQEIKDWWKLVVNNVEKNKKTGLMPVNSFYIPSGFANDLLKEIKKVGGRRRKKYKSKKKRYRKLNRKTKKRRKRTQKKRY